MITFKHKGNFKHTTTFLKNSNVNYKSILEKYGQIGVDALEKATPKDTGRTAMSWGYKITASKGQGTIYWTNSNVVDETQIAIILQYGHATNNGGFVEGKNYINPALQPVFDKIADDLWREVTKR